MEVQQTNRDGNSIYIGSIGSNGIFGNIIGIIFSCIFLFISIIIGIFSFGSTYQAIKTRNYPETTAQVINQTTEDDFVNSEISYTVDGKDYTYIIMGSDDLKIGDSITVYYNPKHKEQVYWGDRNIPFVIPIVAFVLLVTGIFALRRNVKKLKHSINPDKYAPVIDNGNSAGIAFGESALKQSDYAQNSKSYFDTDDIPEGKSTTFKF